MAKSDAVWGIDIGNCSLKALRCRPAEEEGRVLADAFDYIEYPKILTQPGAEPSELLADALREFLSRNTLKGDRVAISVAGQTGLARFIKLPPVESKKIPDIVKFEAKQQIPFDLERRDLGLPADGRRAGGERVSAGDGDRPVRHEARPGVPRPGAAEPGGDRGRRGAAWPRWRSTTSCASTS